MEWNESSSANEGANNKDPDFIRRQINFTDTLLFETPGGLRFTQDSPILMSVWMGFALQPREQQELILTVRNNISTGVAARQIRTMLNNLRKKRPMIGDKKRLRARVSYIPGQIAAKMYFDEMMRVVLPLTRWWHETYRELRKLERKYGRKTAVADWRPFPQPDPDGQREKDLVDAFMLMRREIDPQITSDESGGQNDYLENARRQYIRDMPADLCWLVRIAGLISDCFLNGTQLLEHKDSLSTLMNYDLNSRKNDRIETLEEREIRIAKAAMDPVKARETREKIVQQFVACYQDWCKNDDYPEDGVIWRATKNRRVHLAVARSALTVKADAARVLFNISCRNITWAVLDSGIDANHPAFKLTTAEHELKVRRGLAENGHRQSMAEDLPIDALDNRVVLTLDFTRLRELLDFDLEIDAGDEAAIAREQRLIDSIASRMRTRGNRGQPSDETIDAAKRLLDGFRKRIEEGKDISWQDLEAAIVVNNPKLPTNDHGTHVAGILGADWIEDIPSERDLPLSQRTRRMRGICPDINLIDVRVFREDGLTDEFELLAAIQFLRWMNSRAGTMQVHGANLSLSLIHEVRRWACGQTPICDECNEASALGMVMVAAAGNRGFEMSDPDEVGAADSYRSVSITDPGNAEHVITVGSTHRGRPHEYGVSYFSSRGPTGDGRLKPDIVAPGEKIKGPTPRGRSEFKDGTSMAAPHVSGIAAMLMARHGELIGQPEHIKKILCNTATDLGRERYFQGHGLVDALRALQSV